MKRLAFLFLALVPLTMPAFADDAAPHPTLTASGTGEVQVIPDIAIVTLGVATDAPTAAAALAGNSSDMTAVIAAIKAAGVADKDIGTSDFAVNPVYSQPPVRDDGSSPPATVTGYRVSNSVRVVIRDFATSGALLDKVVTSGANQVNGIQFDVADRTAAEDKALTAAIGEARRKADLMAAAAGVKIVGVLSVSADGAMPPMPMAREAMAFAAKSVPVMAGETTVSANATVVFQIAAQ